MSTTLTIEEHLGVLDDAVRSLETIARSTPHDTPVPTCPRWDLRALLAHVVMVHAWAAENVRGREGPPSRTQTELRRSDDDLVALLRSGAEDLSTAIVSGSDDMAAAVFLLDAPAPRRFWARRQAHETTIHAVDALAAALGRRPAASEAAVPAPVAVDGIDELARGFVPRGSSRWPVDAPFRLSIAPTDAEDGWLLDIGRDRVVATAGRDTTSDCTFSGTSAELYLGLWNRGDAVVESGRPGTLAHWRQVQRVRWS
jgi:uncharacterized protein (TIGR03083 family)